MKRSWLMSLLLFAPMLLQAQTADIKFDKEKHDFGKVNEADGEARVVFTFTNQGDAPLIIQDVQSSCDCTTPGWTMSPVMPGKQGSVTVVYDTKGRPGMFEKTVNVYNNGKQPLVSLHISGEVVGGLVELPSDAYVYEVPGTTLRMDTKHVSLGSMLSRQTVSSRVNLINTGQQEIRLAVGKTPDHIEAMATPTTIKPGKVGRINIVYDPTKNPAKGFVVDRIPYTVDGQGNESFVITVTAEL